MSQSLLEVLAEFFDAIGSQKAHWYQVFDSSNGDENYPLIQSTFLSAPCYYITILLLIYIRSSLYLALLVA
jgi:hypothetical protein